MKHSAVSAKRVVSLDFLRTTAIMAVVALHTLPVPLLNGGLPFWLSVVVESTSKIGVPLFLIISGYLMLDRDYSGSKLKRFFVHNYLPLFVSFELWALLVSPVVFLGKESGGVPSLFATMLFMGEPYMIHFWYMQMLLGIYLMVPVLAAFLKRISMDGNNWYLALLVAVSVTFVLVLPTAQYVAQWLRYEADAEITLGGFVGRGALGLLYMLIGYCLRTVDFFDHAPAWARWITLAGSLVLLWMVSAWEYKLTGEFFLVTKGFLPIAFTAFALSWVAIKGSAWNDCPRWLSAVFFGFATYSYGIYMVHLPLHKVVDVILPDAMHLLRVAMLNPISTILLSLLCCWIIARLPVVRRWMLAMK